MFHPGMCKFKGFQREYHPNWFYRDARSQRWHQFNVDKGMTLKVDIMWVCVMFWWIKWNIHFTLINVFLWYIKVTKAFMAHYKQSLCKCCVLLPVLFIRVPENNWNESFTLNALCDLNNYVSNRCKYVWNIWWLLWI